MAIGGLIAVVACVGFLFFEVLPRLCARACRTGYSPVPFEHTAHRIVTIHDRNAKE